MTIYAIVAKYPHDRAPHQITDAQRRLYLSASGYHDAAVRWQRYEQQILAKYNILPEIIALFNDKRLADDFAARHNGDGGCRLSVVERNHLAPLEYEIEVVYGEPKPDSISFPVGVSFKYTVEANAFAQRYALWKGGRSTVTQQRLSVAVA
jgi:hypothetical protein